MTELRKEEEQAQPDSGWAFLKHQRLELPDLRAQLVFWPLVVIGLALDLWSKRIVFDWLQGGSVTLINGFLRLVARENAGAAFGIAAGQTKLLIAVSAIALIMIFVFFFVSGAERRLVHIALGFFAAGVSGNLYDRIFNNGLVRDFIDIEYWPGKHWPAFNVADTMLCIAVALLIISSFRSPRDHLSHLKSRLTRKSSQKRAQQHK